MAKGKKKGGGPKGRSGGGSSIPQHGGNKFTPSTKAVKPTNMNRGNSRGR